jgi:hypothetical protein
MNSISTSPKQPRPVQWPVGMDVFQNQGGVTPGQGFMKMPVKPGFGHPFTTHRKAGR